MSAILDQIKRNAVPAAVLRTASRGALPLPGPEMIEILVYLTQNPIFAPEAKMTLAGWDLTSAIETVSSPNAPAAVLGYYWAEQNRRPALMPALIENPAINDNMLMELAGEAPREIVSILLASARIRHLPGVMEALSTNPRVLPAELQGLHGEPPLHFPDIRLNDGQIKDVAIRNATDDQADSLPAIVQSVNHSQPLSGNQPAESFPEFAVVPEIPPPLAQVITVHSEPAATASPVNAEEDPASIYADTDPETEAIRLAWEKQYAAEIAAAESEPFDLVSEEEDEPAGTEDSVISPASQEAPHAETEAAAGTEAVPQEAASAPNAPSASGDSGAGQGIAIAALALHQKAAAIEAKKLTIMQRLGRMKAGERIKTAFLGGKEERSVLIRDRARIVQNAVLSSPKLTDSEVEMFAAAKNLDENVLREIARNRRFMKNYPVVRNLATNPKTPLDVAMPLVKMLMLFDLKSLQKSKSVSDVIRKMAQKYYQEKATSGGKTKS